MCKCDLEFWCFENKRKSRRCVCFWSFLTLLSTGGTAFFALQLRDSEMFERVEPQIDYLRVEQVRQRLFEGLMALAVFIAILSCFGMLFKWMRNRCCTIIYGTLMLPFWIIAISVGLSAMFLAHTAADEFTKECRKLQAEQASAKAANPGLIFSDLSVNFNLFRDVQINQHMCSRNCPCSEDVPTKEQWLDISERDLLVKYDRTAPFQFKAFPGETYTVSTFEECIERVDENFYALPAFKQFAFSWKTSAGHFDEKDFMKWFEYNHDCSGICEEPLFYFARSVDFGVPQSCFGEIEDEVRRQMYFLGATMLVSGLLTTILWTFQYCLWRKY